MIEGFPAWCGELSVLSKDPQHLALQPTLIILTILKIVTQSLGDLCDSGTPGYISNPVVKPASADGTWGATPWESRSSPRDFVFKHP